MNSAPLSSSNFRLFVSVWRWLTVSDPSLFTEMSQERFFKRGQGSRNSWRRLVADRSAGCGVVECRGWNGCWFDELKHMLSGCHAESLVVDIRNRASHQASHRTSRNNDRLDLQGAASLRGR